MSEPTGSPRHHPDFAEEVSDPPIRSRHGTHVHHEAEHELTCVCDPSRPWRAAVARSEAAGM
jgi:hypothetical protein